MGDPRPNFYELLELDPSVDDWSDLKQAIDKRKKYWSQIYTQRKGTRKGTAAKANLDLLPEIERVLSDPTLRRQEAEARRAELNQGQQQKLHDLDQLIETFRDRGHITEAQVAKLAERFAEVISRPQLEERLRSAGVPIGGPSSGAEAFHRQDFLEDSKLEEIRHALSVLGLADLYQFLGLSAASSPTELAARGKQRYQERAGRADDESAAIQKLGGLAQEIFASNAGKDRYDATLATLPMRELRDQIELMVDGNELAYDDFERLAAMAGRHGVDVEAAKSFLGWFAEQRGWILGDPPEMPVSPNPGNREWEIRMEQLFRAIEAQQRAAQTQQTAAPPPPPPGPRVDPPPPIEPEPHHPLQAPPSIHVQPVKGGFDIEWPPVHEPGASYWVVRKEGGPPMDEGDGVGVELAVCRFEDRNVPPGAWYYGVFTLVQDSISPHPIFSGPHRPARRPAGAKAAAAAVILAGAYTAAWAMGLVPPQPTPPPDPPDPPPQQPVTPPQSTSIPGVLPPPVMPPAPPPPPPAQIRKAPKVLVVANGEPQVKRSVENKLVGELRQRGLDVEAGSGRFLTGDYIARGGASSALALLQTLDMENVDVLVFAAVEPRGQRQLTYLGRTEVIYTSQIQARAYVVRDRSQHGALSSGVFEYTALNLDENLEDALYDIGAPLASAALAGWSKYRQSQGLTP